MMLILFFTAIYLFYVFHDIIPIYKAEKHRVFWGYVSMFAFSYIVFLLILLDVKLPSPAEPLRKAVTFIFGVKTTN